MKGEQLAIAIAKIVADLGLIKEGELSSFNLKLVIQKVGYLLQKVGCDVGLKFGWYSMGPYSKGLQNYYSIVVDLLVERDIKGLNLELDEETAKCVEKTERFLEEFQKVTENLDVKSLEALASLIMLCSEIYPKPEDPVEEFLRRKNSFPRNIVERIWRFLVDKNICVE